MAYHYDPDYEAAAMAKVHKEPVLKTDRSALKLYVLNFLTLGIYPIIFFIPFSFDLDKIAPKRYGGKTFNYLFAHILALLTGNVFLLFWHHHITERVEEALAQREINYSFQTSDVWIWYFLGSFFLIGPCIYFHKLCKAMNLLCEDYNREHQQA